MSSNRFRRIALSLPGTSEASHHGHPDFRAGKRVFATLGYPDDGWGMVKLTPEQQSMLVEAEPAIFRPVPGGWGKRGMCSDKGWLPRDRDDILAQSRRTMPGDGL
ncbi:MAG: MmcQ/YjbR family DNA-binding protein [Bradyrhizobium sp.]|nr:MAG: MmcQ/YjbR family DNA-binding protein [Bradyrhizobium sp.]